MSERPTDGPVEPDGATDFPAEPEGPAEPRGLTDGPAVPEGRSTDGPAVPGGPSDGPAVPRGPSERPIETAGARRNRELTRVAVLAVALVFIATFAFLTFASVVEGGFSLASLLSVFILVLFAVGIVGALRNPPR